MAMKKSAKKTAKKAAKKTVKKAARRTAKKSSRRRYGPRAQEKVAEVMHELKAGTLRSGRSKKKVTYRRQAVAIGLSEARRDGARVPPPRRLSERGRQNRRKEQED